MKSQYNQFHNYQLDAPVLDLQMSMDNLMLKYESESIMGSLFKEFNQQGYDKPSYVSQFFVLANVETSDEQMFTYKLYNMWGDGIATNTVKESFLLHLSLKNKLVDVTLLRNKEIKDALKDYGNFAWLEDAQGGEEDNYSFAIDINDRPYDTLGYIDIEPKDDGRYILKKYGVGFYISELHEIEKLFSIFYGSVFSLKFKRIFVKWVRYEVTISKIEVENLSELKETVRTLQYLLKKVDEQVNRD